MTPLAGVTSHVIQLENGQFARLEQGGAVTVYDEEGLVVDAPTTVDIDWDASAATLGGYADFMAKEIAEQPEAIERLLSGRLGEKGIVLDELSMSERELAAIDRVYLIACGTSYHVSLIARTLIQTWAKVPVICDYASEFNYEQDVLVTPHTLCVIITQSGETADTLTAARRMRGMGCKVFAVTNVLGSTAAREADGVLYVQAGPEVCVASTKAYTAQMVASALLALRLAQAKRQMDLPEVRRHYRDLCTLPDLIREVISRSWQDKRAAVVFRRRAIGALPRPRRQRHDGLRGVAQAQGDQLPARRGLSGGRDEARAIALLEPGSGGRHRAGRPRARQDRLSHTGGHRARAPRAWRLPRTATRRWPRSSSTSCGSRLVADELLVPIVAVVHPADPRALCGLGRAAATVDKPRNLAKSRDRRVGGADGDGRHRGRHARDLAHGARARAPSQLRAPRLHGRGARLLREERASGGALRRALRRARGVLKALGTGFSGGIGLRDVSVTRDEAGRPRVLLAGRAAEVARERGVREIALSISHTRDVAVANALAVTDEVRPAPPERDDAARQLAASFKEAPRGARRARARPGGPARRHGAGRRPGAGDPEDPVGQPSLEE